MIILTVVFNYFDTVADLGIGPGCATAPLKYSVPVKATFNCN